MARIGFLGCAATLPAHKGGAAERRGDAFEHDLEVAALRPPFADAGLELVEIDWRAPIEAFDGLEMVLLGTAWDYQDHPDEFIARLDALAARGIAVCNSPEAVRWNADKRYLRELEAGGAVTVPTLWCDDATSSDLAKAMDHFASDRVVIKRQTGAGGLGQHSFTRDTMPGADWRMGRRCMIQPFLPAIREEGEFTFVFIDGTFSHGVRKTPATDDYRIQSLYGGCEAEFAPSADDLATAQAVVDALPFADLLYARVDMVRLPDGRLAVMEAELIEPYLYPEQGSGLGAQLAAAIVRHLEG
ncbi:ATP-grasp domain-containing protein [Qipengyuania sp. SM2507]